MKKNEKIINFCLVASVLLTIGI